MTKRRKIFKRSSRGIFERTMKKIDTDKLGRVMGDLLSLVRRLRGPNGCPWDAKQDNHSIKVYLIEEAYEVLDAIENASSEETCGELGDLLFQIIFLTALAEENGEFDFVEVVEKITEKNGSPSPPCFFRTQRFHRPTRSLSTGPESNGKRQMQRGPFQIP